MERRQARPDHQTARAVHRAGQDQERSEQLDSGAQDQIERVQAEGEVSQPTNQYFGLKVGIE